jgi:hypothetical protein
MLDREIAPVERAFAALGKTVTGIVPGVQLTTRAFIAMGAQSVVGGILAVGGALNAASGALGVIPAAGVAAASAVGALAIGLRGVEDVLKDFDDAEDFAAGLEELSTNARSALGVLNEMRDEINSFRDSIQDALFEGMDQVFRDLGGTFLPRIEKHFGALASTINGAGKDLAGFLQQANTLADIDTIMSNNELAFRTLRSAVVPAATAIRDIVTVGSGSLPGLADEVLRLTLRFQNFIAMARVTGQLDDWIAQGIETVKQFGRILGNVGGSFNALFSTAEDAGLGFLDTLESLTERMQVFLESAEGQNSVREFLSTAQQSGEALLPVIKAVASVFVEDLFPILADLGTTVSPAVSGFINQLGAALTIAAPGIQAFAQGFANFIVAITPALPAIGTLVGQIGELVGAMATGFGPAIAGVVVAITNILIPAVNALTWVFQSVSPEVLKIVVVLGTMIVTIGALTSIVRGVQTIMALFAGGLDLLAGATQKAQGGIKGFLGFLSGPWGIAIGLATTALGLFLSTTDNSNEKQREMAAVGKEVNDVIREQAGVINEAVRAKAAEKLEEEGALELATRLGIKTGDLTSAYLDQGNSLEVLRKRLQEIAKQRQVDEGALQQGVAADEMTDEAIAAQDLLNKLNDLVGGRDADTEAQKRQEEAARTGGTAIQFLTAALEAQRIALNLVHEARLREQQQALESLNTDIAYFNQLERTRIELEEGAKTLDILSQEGRDNLAVVTQLVAAGNSRIEEMRTEGATNEQLNAVIQEQETQLLNLLQPFFDTREAARLYAVQLGLIPANVKTKAELQAEQALTAVQNVINRLNSIPATKDIYVYLHQRMGSTTVRDLDPSYGGYGGLASGGMATPGKWTWVGEEGPELVRFGRGARVFSNDESMHMARDVSSLDQMTSRGGSGPTKTGGPSTLAATINVAAPTVKVLIDGQEVRGIVRVELDERDRQLTQLVNVGTGRRQ